MKIRLLALAFAGTFLAFTSSAQFADSVVSYGPGTGFSSGFTNAAAALGAPGSTFTPFSPPFRNTQLVSVGAGGSLTLQFNNPIQNDPAHPYGLDFIVFGNSFFVITNGNFSGGGITDGSVFGTAPGSTEVEVSRDNQTYYLLNPGLAPTVNNLYPSDSTGNFNQAVNPALGNSDFAGQGLTGIRSFYAGSAGGTGYDISWAEDASGNSVYLPDINYVRIDVLSGKAQVDAIAVVPEPGALILLFFAEILVRTKQLISKG